MSYNTGLIGLGNMATALIEGWIKKGRNPKEIIGFDIKRERCESLKRRFDIEIADRIEEISAKMVIIAIKPQDFSTLNLDLPVDTLIVSIMAGVPIRKIEEVFDKNPVIRVMPNLLCSINKSFIPFACNEKVSKSDREFFISIFRDFGEVVEIKESLMNIMTALNGSGPGFVAYLIEAFTEAGVYNGLAYDTALKLTLSIFEGTASLLRENDISPNSFRIDVTSPGGTTSRGVWVLEKSGLKGAIYDMLRVSGERAKELENS